MTPEQINTVIAEWCGEKLFVIRKPIHDPFGYYRKNAQGYTCNINEAWKVTAEVAAKYTTGPAYENEPDKVIAEPAPIPNYYGDMNAIHEAYMNLMEGQKYEYISHLLAVIHDVGSDYYNTIEWSLAVDLLDSTAPQRCEALLRTIGKWEKSK